MEQLSLVPLESNDDASLLVRFIVQATRYGGSKTVLIEFLKDCFSSKDTITSIHAAGQIARLSLDEKFHDVATDIVEALSETLSAISVDKQQLFWGFMANSPARRNAAGERAYGYFIETARNHGSVPPDIPLKASNPHPVKTKWQTISSNASAVWKCLRELLSRTHR